ncbi:DUF5063 domain-containing protein [Sphingomonas hylomeconis]|uniref:DUF5063 domain-containing protein n=1 Tax=Sphingomonas hylomeconis TaxID=1395958 RepID=A0ABV7STL9_9SPHN|nr:DUF5063 domain-containing protein [Sphingomonas hylomeconis]
MAITDQIAIIKGACRSYLDLLGSASGEPHERQARLAEALDRLCAAYNQADDVEPDTVGVDSPSADMQQFGKQAAASFPELGFYPEVDPLDGFEQKIGQGWGLDDLTDIAVDLTEVLWLFDHDRTNDAIWTFRWGYQSHWGHHLHDLRRYLHKLLYWG